jgi:DNA-binding transcriptional MerR regulator
MTVGELAMKMNTTVRTLQYYDREGLLSPSKQSDGGLRLYTDKDIVRLHQIQSMKYLGFSLEEIKKRLIALETPADVKNALSEQARSVMEKISSLSEVLLAIEALKMEIEKMNTTVRTLQYYDREGLLSPSRQSDGGLRLYTDKDMVKLHQIQSMKYLGFSLEEIKKRLIALETPADVKNALSEQARGVMEKISSLSEVLLAIEALKTEIEQMNTVDWSKYADIIALLQTGNKEYWVLKNFDRKVLEHIKSRDKQSSEAFEKTWEQMCNKAIKLQENGMPPESEPGQAFAKEWWEMVAAYIGGDMGLLPGLVKFNENRDGWDALWRAKWESAVDYAETAMSVDFDKLGYNPLKEAGK